MRNIHKNVPVLFKPYAWKVEEQEYREESNKNNETIFSIGNGYIGLRGFFEEGFYGGKENTDSTVMINGIYEYYDYNHIWCRPGFPTKFHAITPQVNPIEVSVYINNEKASLCGNVGDYSREICMQNGVLTRKFKFTTSKGACATIIYERFCLQQEKHLGAMLCKVLPDCDCEVKIVSKLRSCINNGATSKEEFAATDSNIFDFIKSLRKDKSMQVLYKTKRSKFMIACSVCEDTNVQGRFHACDESLNLSNIYEFSAKSNQEITLTRVFGFATDKDTEDCERFISNKVEKAFMSGYANLYENNREVWDKFWNIADISIDSDTLIQQGIRFSMFHIYQSSGKDGVTNISANGLTGTGYSGHTFWDTEIFMMPMFMYTMPDIARQLLKYRFNILDKARERAAQMDDLGALFSWNSINGEECGHVFEAATAQYHINLDIFYAIYRYMEATCDWEFMTDYGAEILLEMSKCMAHRGNFIPLKGNKFCINVICGPDEYNPVVDNNLYTNMLTRKMLYYTLDVMSDLKERDVNKYNKLIDKCKITEDERDLWKRAADNMYIPYNNELDIYMQDDNFLYKDPIDLEKIDIKKLPLLTNLHPLNLWRYQVIKQADIVLLTFLQSEEFSHEMRKKIFDFYEPKTIHDSSLSAGIHSIVACDVGYNDEAYNYLKQSCRMDLDNVNRNTFFGLHTACMGSAWMMIVNGYGGLRIIDGNLHFKPFCDSKWQELSFKINFKGNLLKVKISKDSTEYTSVTGGDIKIIHNEKEYIINAKKSLVINSNI